MLRINLLPPTVNQRRLTKRLIAGFAVLTALCIALPLLYSLKLTQELKDQTQQAQEAVQGKAVTDALKQTATSTLAQIQPIQSKVDFVTAVHKYHMALVRIYYTLAQYTDSKVIYSDAAYTGPTMTVHAYTPSLAEAGRYLETMYKHIKDDTGPNAVFKSVSIDHVPGYPGGYLYKYYLGNTLVSVGTPPAGVVAPGSVQAPGQNNNTPGFSASAAAGSSVPGAAGQVARVPADAYSEPVTPLQTVYARQLNPLAVPRQAAEFQQELLHKVRAKRVVQGFDFTATLILANPPVAPSITGGMAAPAGDTAASGGDTAASGSDPSDSSGSGTPGPGSEATHNPGQN